MPRRSWFLLCARDLPAVGLALVGSLMALGCRPAHRAGRVEGVAATLRFRCAAGSEAWCWGANNVLVGFAQRPQRAPLLDGARAIALAPDAVSFVSRTGEVYWLGDTRVRRGGALLAGDTMRRPHVVSGIANARDVVIGHAGWACSSLADGHVSCWGGANCAAGASVGEPLMASLVSSVEGTVSLSMSLDVACTVSRSGALWCWGDGFHPASRDDRDCLPAKLEGVEDALDVSVSVSGVCVARARHPVSCWAAFWGGGREASGVMRFAPTASDPPIALRGSNDIVRVWNRDYYVVGLTGAGVLLGWGRLPGSADGTVDVRTAAPIALATEVVAFDGDQHGYCVLLRSGAVLCAGSNIRGELGAPNPSAGSGLVRVRF